MTADALPPAEAASVTTPPVLGGARLPEPLAGRVGSAVAELAVRGVGLGTRVALDGADPLPWFLACDVLGAAALVVEPRWTDRERAAVLDDARPGLVLDLGEPTAAPAAHSAAGDGSTPFYLPTTSGSSGRPKVLLRTRDSWLRSFAALGPVPGPVLVGGPLSSSLFLFGALHALWCGAELILRPRLDAADLDTAATTHVVPAMLAALRGTGALRTVVCGGAHLDPVLRERLPVSVVEYYGSAEHSLIALRGSDGLRAVPGVELDVRAGELWVRSPLAVAGHMRSGVLDPAPEWTATGDRVDLTDGVLTVHGRDSATISTGGLLVAAEEVEAVLRRVPGVSDVVVTGTPQRRLGAVVTALVEGEPELRALREAARAGLEPRKRPRIWLRGKDFPRTPSGKPARAAIAEGLAAGTLDAEPLR